MSRPTQTLPDATGRVREHFRRKAFSFDHLYDEEHTLQRLLRPGLFDRRELALAVAREYEAPSVLVVASYPRWTWTKGPIRKLRYEVINNCPIFDYTEEGLRKLFADAGFARVALTKGRSGFLVKGDRY